MRKGIRSIGRFLAAGPWFAFAFGPPEISIYELAFVISTSLAGVLLVLLTEIRIVWKSKNAR